MEINFTENSILTEFRKTIWSKFRRGVRDYQLISPGDRIAVCISGGKDSMLLAKCIQRLCRNREIPFEAEYIVMNPGYTPETLSRIEENIRIADIPAQLWETRIFDSAADSGSDPCFLCSRLRRGWLYKKAAELGCNKIALGHHFDDVIETILMGMLYGSQMQTMMPKLHAENYPGMELIRPLYLVREADVIRWAEFNGLEFARCGCGLGEKTDGTGSKRSEIKALLKELRQKNPAVDMNIFRSAENVNLRTLISYRSGSERHHFLDDYDLGLPINERKTEQKNHN